MAKSSVLGRTLRATKGGLAGIVVATIAINFLGLSSMFYMEGVFDRVFPTRNVDTLLFMTAFMLVALLTWSVLDSLRGLLFSRTAVKFDRALSGEVFRAVCDARVLRPDSFSVSPTLILRDVDVLRDAISGPPLQMIVDAPFAPVYVLAVMLIHPLVGLVLLVGLVVIVCCGVWTKFGGAEASLRSISYQSHASDIAAAMMRGAEPIRAMGMLGGIATRWKDMRDAQLDWTAVSTQRAAGAQVLLSLCKLALPYLVFACAAYLAISQQVSPGATVMTLLLSYRAIGPASGLVQNWRVFVSAYAAWKRVDRLISSDKEQTEFFDLPRPLSSVEVQDLWLSAGPTRGNILEDVSFSVPQASVVALLGPSGAGKSCLARAMVGAWKVDKGTIRLGAGEIRSYSEKNLGEFIGYLPQDVDLLPGTVAENIGRFKEPLDFEMVVEAANLADVHGLVQRLPDGYNTVVGPSGAGLSGGQRQRLGLARAVYGRPALVVLDEPNSSLDSVGEAALLNAVMQLKRSGSTVVIISHKSSVMALADYAVILAGGRLRAFGQTSDVLKVISRPNVVQLASER